MSAAEDSNLARQVARMQRDMGSLYDLAAGMIGEDACRRAIAGPAETTEAVLDAGLRAATERLRFAEGRLAPTVDDRNRRTVAAALGGDAVQSLLAKIAMGYLDGDGHGRGRIASAILAMAMTVPQAFEPSVQERGADLLGLANADIEDLLALGDRESADPVRASRRLDLGEGDGGVRMQRLERLGLIDDGGDLTWLGMELLIAYGIVLGAQFTQLDNGQVTLISGPQ